LFPLFKNESWAKGYDLIIHDECAALKKDETELTNILNAHKTVPAVHLHCAMHSFRTNDDWAKHVGMKSNRHGPHVPVSLEFTEPRHPITKPFKNWVTGKEELYNNVEVLGAETLATGTQTYKRGDKEKTDTAIVMWVNTKSGAPSFSTSLGHFNHNVEDSRYLDLVTRGALWVCGKLDDPAYKMPYTGRNHVQELETKESREAKKRKSIRPTGKTPTPAVPQAPTNATMAKVTAKSVQANREHYPWMAIDGHAKTRWCGDGPEMPSWIQLDLQKSVSLSAVEIDWEISGQWMRYTIDASTDGKKWTQVLDASANQTPGTQRDKFSAENIQFLRVNLLKQQKGMWPSLYELRLYGTDGEQLPVFPKVEQSETVTPNPNEKKKHSHKRASDKGAQYKHKGNVAPTAHRLSASEEAKLLKDVTVPEGFTVSLFAPWQMANYPTYLAAAPNGDLYVSSDGNASIGRSAARGRVLRLRDTDRDGRADQVTEFAPDVDSPRGILWDHDRLYVLHPPHISVYHDRDGDGVAEDSKRLISNIAFGFKDRPADHTTNGLEMGIDGWIYVAVGDFGFMKATGTDGRELQMRGGGVVRFRPDGSGLETFSSGTRNIYGIAVSPTLDMFSRDNTNDGGGWNVRFHHHSGLEDHGYPRLYKNFAEEIVAPLADYGGGSGCGAFYLDEPGIPDPWNQAPYTCDWGREGSYRHPVEQLGATFKETAAPQQFFKMTRPTDGDVDGNSAVYQASWKGPAQFTWGGVNHGYIARMAPTRFKPTQLPEFDKLTDAQLVELLRSSPSHVRRLSAQRTLLRRPTSAAMNDALLGLVKDQNLDLSHRVAALFAITQRGLDSKDSRATLEMILPAAQANDPLLPLVVRAVGDMGIDLRTQGKPGPVPTQWLKEKLASGSPRQINEAIVAAVRQGKSELGPAIAAHLSNEDPVLVHTAFQGLAKLGNFQAALPHLEADKESERTAAAWALMRMHQPAVVSALLGRLASQAEPAKRLPIIATLARLYHHEANWKGDSWGTRPDTRGPYYQLTTWDQSPRILKTFNELLKSPETTNAEAAYLARMMGKNRIQNNESLDRFIALAAQDPALIPTVINQLADSDEIPSQAISIVLKSAQSDNTPPATLKECVRLLINLDHPEAFTGIMSALEKLQVNGGASKERDQAREFFLASTKLENHCPQLVETFNTEKLRARGIWCSKALLQLANSTGVSKEVQAQCRETIDRAWSDEQKKLSLLEGVFWTRNPYLNDRVLSALSDPNPRVARSAEKAVKRLRIQKPGEDKTPKIAGLQPEDAINQVVAFKDGDVALGEAIFTRANCVACHTVRMDEKQKGPFLGNIANTYKRKDLTTAILQPSKTLAQGFATNIILDLDGRSITGYVTLESAEKVVMRDSTGKEFSFLKDDIDDRAESKLSAMPKGLMDNFSVKELASLVDYIESLAKK